MFYVHCLSGVSHQELDEAIGNCVDSDDDQEEIVTVFWK